MKKLVFLFFYILLFTNTLLTHAQKIELNPTNNRILVISGGGSKGAWGAALTKRLSEHYGGLYPLIIGTSTGALIAPFASIGKFDTLNKLYRNLTPEQIFVRSPIKPLKKNFNVRKMPSTGVIPKYSEGDLRFGRVFSAFFKKKNYLGDATPFREYLTVNYKENDFNRCKLLNHEIVVCITNFNKGTVEYKSSKEVSGVEDMKNWIYASSSEPMFMGPYEDITTNFTYYDGGVINNVPIQYAIDQINENEIYKDVMNIDVIVHNPGSRLLDSVWSENTKLIYHPITGTTVRAARNTRTKLLAALIRYTEIARNTIRMDDIEIIREKRVIPDSITNFKDYIKVSIYYMPDELIVPLNGNDLKFDQAILANQSDSGSTHNLIPDDTFYIKRRNINKLYDKIYLTTDSAKKGNLANFSYFELEKAGFDALLAKQSDEAIKYFEFISKSIPTYHNVYEILKLVRKQTTNGSSNWLKIYRDIAYLYTWKMKSDYIEKFQDSYITELKKSKK